MKTKLKSLRTKHYVHYKPSAVKICTPAFLIFIMLLSNGCQKNINEGSSVKATSSAGSDFQVEQHPASVATDWYKLQLRFLLEKNSSLPNGACFGYIGIGLHESVRCGIPNAVSLSKRLYQMPATC